MHIKPEEITSIIKNEIKNYEKEMESCFKHFTDGNCFDVRSSMFWWE